MGDFDRPIRDWMRLTSDLRLARDDAERLAHALNTCLMSDPEWWVTAGAALDAHDETLVRLDSP